MQPLTPNERRLVESVKELLGKNYGHIAGVARIDDYDNLHLYMDSDGTNKDLWLKVLSMALEHNEDLTSEWRKR